MSMNQIYKKSIHIYPFVARPINVRVTTTAPHKPNVLDPFFCSITFKRSNFTIIKLQRDFGNGNRLFIPLGLKCVTWTVHPIYKTTIDVHESKSGGDL